MLKPANVLAVLTALVLVGCSTAQDKDEYVSNVSDIQADIDEALSSYSPTDSVNPQESIKALRQVESKIATAVDELNSVDVPSEAEESHAELVQAYEDLGKLFGSLEKVVAKGPSSSLAQHFSKDVGDIEGRIREAIDKINEDLGAT